MKVWTGLCQPSENPADADFLAVYPHVTTVRGTTFDMDKGVAYANRYAYVAPTRRRTTTRRKTDNVCRQPRPQEEWIPVPVPAIVDEATHQQAAAQLARNAARSFRNNRRHEYLLRCLLVCRTCGRAMFGLTYPAGPGRGAHSYYKCHGKDADSERICPQSRAKVEELDAAVWDHVTRLLDDPATLLAQFEAYARRADEARASECAEEQRLAAQLRRLDREEQRLVDAYQAEAIDLAELRDRHPEGAVRPAGGPPLPAADGPTGPARRDRLLRAGSHRPGPGELRGPTADRAVARRSYHCRGGLTGNPPRDSPARPGPGGHSDATGTADRARRADRGERVERGRRAIASGRCEPSTRRVEHLPRKPGCTRHTRRRGRTRYNP